MLQASASSANFLSALTNAVVQAGGAIIDTNGNNVTVAQSLTHDPNLGAVVDGGLTKNGAGLMTLAGINTYTGATTISAGTLQIGGLTHRWSFNGNLTDSVGGGTATITSGTTAVYAATVGPTAVTMLGGGHTTSQYVSLGQNLLPTSGGATIELWATQNQIQNWGRIFDFGNGTGNYLMMSWTQGTAGTADRVEWVGNGTTTANNTMAPYNLGTEYHIAMVLTPSAAGTAVTWYAAPAGGGSIAVKSGSFTTNNTLAALGQTNLWLGQSQFSGDNVASASYDEVRFWNAALPLATLNANQAAGPDVLPWTAPGVLPVTPLNVASGATLDLCGQSQGVTTLNDVGGAGGTVTNSAASPATLALAPASGLASFSGVIQDGIGTTSLAMNGPAVQVLTGSNTYSGGTTINGGTLQLGNGGAAGSLSPAGTIANNGTLVFSRSNTVVQGTDFSAAPITGTGNVVQMGSGLLVLGTGTAGNAYSGGTTVSSGTLQLANPAALGTGGLTANGGLLDLNGNNLTIAGNNALPSLSGQAGVITDNSPAATTTFTVNQATNTTFGGSLQTGAGGCTVALIKAGPGSLTLSGTSTTAGATVQNSGTLAIAGSLTTHGASVNNTATLLVNGGLTSTSDLSVNGGGQLAGSGTINLAGGAGLYVSSTTAFTFPGSLTGVQGVEVDSPTQLTLTGGNNYGGPTLIDAGGLLTAGAANTLSANSGLSVSGTLDVTSAAQTVKSLAFGASGWLNLQFGNVLKSTSAASLNGTLNLSGTTGGPQDLMNYLSVSGSFANTFGIPSGYKLRYGNTELDLVLIGPATWAAAQSGNWSGGANWTTGTAPGGAGQAAVVNVSTTAAQTVTLDAPVTLGALLLGNSSGTSTGYILSGSGTNQLTLDNSGSGATIEVTDGTHAINAPVVLNDNLAVTGSGLTAWTLGFGTAGGITESGGSRTLSLNAANGTLVLGGSNGYTGGTVVEAGTLIATTNAAVPDGTSLTVGGGGVFLFDPTVSVQPQAVSPASQAAAVPEPGTMVLVLAALWSAVIYYRFSFRPKAFGARQV